MHLQMIRPNVRLVRNSGSWPHTLLDLAQDDLVIAFDVRRYENTTLQMTQMCHDRGAQICLFTDEWRSPVHRIATHTFSHRIGVPSAWDSMLPLMMLSECAIAAVQERLWDTVQERTDALETMFDQTKLFRNSRKTLNKGTIYNVSHQQKTKSDFNGLDSHRIARASTDISSPIFPIPVLQLAQT